MGIIVRMLGSGLGMASEAIQYVEHISPTTVQNQQLLT